MAGNIDFRYFDRKFSEINILKKCVKKRKGCGVPQPFSDLYVSILANRAKLFPEFFSSRFARVFSELWGLARFSGLDSVFEDEGQPTVDASPRDNAEIADFTDLMRVTGAIQRVRG